MAVKCSIPPVANDVERNQMQAKMHLYTHISAYIQAFKHK